MKNTQSSKEMWSSASGEALVLGLIPVAYSLISMLAGRMDPDSVVAKFISTVLLGILWLVKFIGCIMLMRFFLKRFAESNPGNVQSDVFRYGLIISIMSAFICATYCLVDILYLHPDTYMEAFDTMLQTNGAMLDSNSMGIIEQFKDNLPIYGFFGNLIYCFLFGMVLSAIISGRVVSDNPFDNSKPDEQ